MASSRQRVRWPRIGQRYPRSSQPGGSVAAGVARESIARRSSAAENRRAFRMHHTRPGRTLVRRQRRGKNKPPQQACARYICAFPAELQL